MSIILGIAGIYVLQKASLHIGYYSNKMLERAQNLKKKYFPDPPPDVYIDFNIFYDEYNLPNTHEYDSSLKYKVKSGMKASLLDAVTEAINRDYYKLYNILESSNDIQQGIKFSRLFDDFQRLSKRGNRDIRLLKDNIILSRPLTRNFKIATIIDPTMETPVAVENEKDKFRPLFLRDIANPKVYPVQPMSLDVPHRSSRVEYTRFGDFCETYNTKNRKMMFPLMQNLTNTF